MPLPAFLARLSATRFGPVAKRIFAGVYGDGFVFAGNLAYLSLLTLFPFFIVVATLAGSLGRTDDGIRAVNAFLRTVPPDVATLIAAPIAGVITARSGGGVLTLGILVTLWTVSGFIETIREIIRRAYGTVASHAAWKYRVGAMLLVIAAVVLMVAAFIAQFVLTGVEQFIARIFPLRTGLIGVLGAGRLAPAVALMTALWLIFRALTPKRYRGPGCRIWPGPLLTTTVWIGTTMLLPPAIGLLGGYDLTYGSLAGVIVALLFFYIIGLGLVLGAQLNAALAIGPELSQDAGAATAGAAGVQGSPGASAGRQGS